MALKSNPTGIRFDLEKVEFIKTREKLKSNQQVVDFLMNKYWWEWKMPVPTYKETPPLNLKTEIVGETPKTQQPKIIRRKTPQEWVIEKRDIVDGDIEGYKQWFSALESCDYLTSKDKSLIKQS